MSGATAPTTPPSDPDTPSRTNTAVDIPAQRDGPGGPAANPHHKSNWEAAEEAPVKPLADYEAKQEGPAGAEVKLSKGRKWFLLFIFSVAQVCLFPSLLSALCLALQVQDETTWLIPGAVPRYRVLFWSVRLYRCHPH